MPWRTDLLEPIPGANPCGADLRYEPVYKEIQEARREDVDAPQGDWVQERKVADWPLVVKLAGEVLAKRSKDLQVAAWLTEAMLRREGYPGLRGGLDCIAGMLEKFWDGLYPEIEDGDVELRAAPLEWMGLKLEPGVKSVAINSAGHDWYRFTDSRSVPLEETVKNDANKVAARKKLIDGGKLAPEQFDKAVDEAGKAFYKQLIGEIDGCLAAIKNLGKLCDAKFGDSSPSFGGLRKPLEEVRQVIHPILKKKLELDPDPPEAEPVPETADEAAATGDATAGTEGESGGMLSAEPTSRNDALSRAETAARYLRRTEPGNPAPFLLLRGLRWGEIRACGETIRARLLEPPATPVRTRLKSLLLDQKWPELLEASETAMGQPCGRGWLDLQRYALTALERMGDDYHLAAKAVRAALREYLDAAPALPSMTMMDDTPVANEETREWLKKALETTAFGANGAGGHGGAGEENGVDGRESKTYERAMEAVRSGNAEGGIGMLMAELGREASARGRFRRKTELAAALVESGREAIALPLLQDLAAQIEALKLEEWESGDVVAEPLVLLYRCMTKLNGDEVARNALYLRICRLDPLRALSCVAR